MARVVAGPTGGGRSAAGGSRADGGISKWSEAGASAGAGAGAKGLCSRACSLLRRYSSCQARSRGVSVASRESQRDVGGGMVVVDVVVAVVMVVAAVVERAEAEEEAILASRRAAVVVGDDRRQSNVLEFMARRTRERPRGGGARECIPRPAGSGPAGDTQ